MKKLQENECWNYGESNYKLLDKYERLDVSWVGVGMSKEKFIQTIAKSGFSDGGPTWIRERTGESGNELQLKIAKKNAGKVVCIVDGLNSENEQGKIMKILKCI